MCVPLYRVRRIDFDVVISSRPPSLRGPTAPYLGLAKKTTMSRTSPPGGQYSVFRCKISHGELDVQNECRDAKYSGVSFGNGDDENHTVRLMSLGPPSPPGDLDGLR